MMISPRTALSAIIAVVIFTMVVKWVPGQDQGEERILDEIVAKVNQDVITLTDLQSELRLLRLSLREEVQDPNQLEEAFQTQKRNLLKSLIQNRIMLQKAEELGLLTDVDREVSLALEQMRQQMGIPSLEVLEQLLQQRGTNLQEYRENLKERMVLDWLVQQSVYSKIALLTSEIEDYYNTHQDQFSVPARVSLAEIVFLKEGTPADQLQTRAQQAYQKLQSGTPFEDVARDHSDGPTASKGGTIGDFPEGALDQRVEEKVFSLNEGQHTDIIETDYGLVIFKVVGREPRTVQPLEDVTNQIRRQLYQQKAQPELKAFVDDLIEQSFIFVADKYRQEYDVADLVR